MKKIILYFLIACFLLANIRLSVIAEENKEISVYEINYDMFLEFIKNPTMDYLEGNKQSKWYLSINAESKYTQYYDEKKIYMNPLIWRSGYGIFEINKNEVEFLLSVENVTEYINKNGINEKVKSCVIIGNTGINLYLLPNIVWIQTYEGNDYYLLLEYNRSFPFNSIITICDANEIFTLLQTKEGKVFFDYKYLTDMTFVRKASTISLYAILDKLNIEMEWKDENILELRKENEKVKMEFLNMTSGYSSGQNAYVSSYIEGSLFEYGVPGQMSYKIINDQIYINNHEIHEILYRFKILVSNNFYNLCIDLYSDEFRWDAYNPSSWAVEEVEAAISEGVIITAEEEQYKLYINRRRFAEFAVHLYEKLTNRNEELIIDNPFVDTDNQKVLLAYQLGIVKGTSANTFEPNKRITRAEMATMIKRTLQIAMPEKYDAPKSFELTYLDNNLIPSWAYDSIMFVTNYGIMQGSGNVFSPYNWTTCEQAILIVYRAWNVMK